MYRQSRQIFRRNNLPAFTIRTLYVRFTPERKTPCSRIVYYVYRQYQACMNGQRSI